MPRSRPRSRAETAVTLIERPLRSASALSCRARMRTTDAPTVPSPATPTRSGSIILSSDVAPPPASAAS
jgi:hypothetical protein